MRTTLRSALLVLALVAASAAGATITGRAEGIDGDGLVLGGTHVRLHGIDAPETEQSCAAAAGGTWPCGRAARARMIELTADRRVVCKNRGRDFYGRMLATCRAGDRDLGRALVADGHAWAHTRYAATDYVADAAAARRAGRGVWQAETPPPWVWRRDAPPPDACTIKGNISAAGTRIYHTRTSRHYARTKIALARGERWCCSEAAARSAGWRPPDA